MMDEHGVRPVDVQGVGDLHRLPVLTREVLRDHADALQFRELLDAPVDDRDDEAWYVARTRDLHHSAVRRRAVPGPLGALLSGGNDSSANVSLLARDHGVRVVVTGEANDELCFGHGGMVQIRDGHLAR
jgi:hypothetical protein